MEMEKGSVKLVGVWIRVSTEDQAKGESPEHHEKRARYYAESKAWKVKEVYHLEAVSGKSVKEHPETQRMLADVKNGRITGLIFSKLARLARNTRELLEFADFFSKYEADLISLQEAIDTSSPAGRLFYTIIAAMAQWEREEIASRVAASVPIRAKLGKPLGGAAPFGYQWKEGKLVPDPEESSIRKLIYELFLKEKRKKRVAKLLNDQGYRTRNGSKFSDTTIERLLRDPSAKGIRRANYTRSLGENKSWELKPQSEWVLIPVEPIIDEGLWQQCNDLLDQRKKDGKAPGPKPVHLFTGIAYCYCGQKMYVPSNVPKYICYKCRNKIGIPELESVFHAQLKNFFFSEEEVKSYLQEASKTLQDKQELLVSLEKEQDRLKQEMDKIMRLYLDDQISSEGFGKQHKPLELRAKQIEDQIPELQGEIDFLKIKLQSSNEIINEAKDLYSKWSDLTLEEKRRTIEDITENIIVSQDSVIINLCHSPLPHTPLSETIAGKQRNFIPALPYTHWKLKTQKPDQKQIDYSRRYPKRMLYSYPCKTLGDHIRKRRLDLGLSQRQVAAIFQTNEQNIYSWEANLVTPSLPYIPKIYDFLGYAPLPTPDTSPLSAILPHKLKTWRTTLGLSQESLAKKLGVDETTVAKWERGEHYPPKRYLRLVEEFFGEVFGWEVRV